MIYKEILGLREYFKPVYDLEHEDKDGWKRFIPNTAFYSLLQETINSLLGNEVRKSIWLQGSYGIGKSHATAVIKHLLWDPWEEIEDFVGSFNDEQIKHLVRSFRESHRVFPVVIKGASDVSPGSGLKYSLQKGIEKALRQYQVEEIEVKSDFEHVLEKINAGMINWDRIFEKHRDLEYKFGGKDGILRRLRNRDSDVLAKLENILANEGIILFRTNIEEYLLEVQKKLNDHGVADYFMVYWDEFTSVLDDPSLNKAVSELQNIAELSANCNVFLFLVVHKTLHQFRHTSEDIEKIKDRFEIARFEMEKLTTYHIMERAIEKKDKKKFDILKVKYMQDLSGLVEELSEDGSYEALENLFPIHPYTAYIAHFLARHIGSTERSIFNFLYDEEVGFKKFIEENPGENGEVFLTADKLWDFFHKEFESIDSDIVRAVLNKFMAHGKTLDNRPAHLAVFKVILLLNLIRGVVKYEEYQSEYRYVAPSEDNIKEHVFRGAINEEQLREVLKYLDEENIVTQAPNGLFEITVSNLPRDEVEKEKLEVKSQIENKGISKFFSNNHVNELKKHLTQDAGREIEVVILDADKKESQIVQAIEKSFKRDWSVHVCLFLGRCEKDVENVQMILKGMSKRPEYKNVFFAVVLKELPEKIQERFIEYEARAKVAERHSWPEEKRNLVSHAEDLIMNWIRDEVQNSYVAWFHVGESGRELYTWLRDRINSDIIPKIFPWSLEKLSKLRENGNLWKFKKSKSAAEIFLTSKNREDFESRTASGLERYLRYLLQDDRGDYIVDSDLRFKEDISPYHPLKKIYDVVTETLNRCRGEPYFNIGEVLEFLTKPPYGLYPCMVGSAVLGFVLRPYVGKLYDGVSNSVLDNTRMRDLIKDILEYWDKKGKKARLLEVRFSSEEENYIRDIVLRIFGDEIKEGERRIHTSALDETRDVLSTWINKYMCPVWLLKYELEKEKGKGRTENFISNLERALGVLTDILNHDINEVENRKVREWYEELSLVEYELGRIVDKVSRSGGPRDPEGIVGNVYKLNEIEDLWFRFARDATRSGNEGGSVESDERKDENWDEKWDRWWRANLRGILKSLKKRMPPEIWAWNKDKVESVLKSEVISRQERLLRKLTEEVLLRDVSIDESEGSPVKEKSANEDEEFSEIAGDIEERLAAAEGKIDEMDAESLRRAVKSLLRKLKSKRAISLLDLIGTLIGNGE